MNITTDASGYYHGNIEELRGRNDPEAVKIAAKEMETLFAYELIKAMRETTGKTSKNDLGGDTYSTMFDMELARLFAERGIGLREMLLKGMNRIIEKSGTRNQEAEISSSPAGNAISPPLPNFGESMVKSGIERTETEEKGEEGGVEKREYETGNGDPGMAKSGQKDDFPARGLNPLPFMPVGGRISSPFGMRRHPIFGDNRFHYGVDIAASSGTSVYPIKKGKVTFSGERSGYGKMVIIRHEDGLVSKYAHNKANLVKEGDEVDTNTVIAQVGSTGISTGPHLHFEISYHGEHIDPMKLAAKGEIKEIL